MADDAAQLALGEHGDDALGDADRGVLRVAAGGERVGLRGRAHVEARHGLPGLLGEAADDRVEARGLLLGDRAGAHRAQRDLVGVEVGHTVHGERHDEGDDQAGRAPERPADQQNDRREKAEEGRGFQPVK